MEFDDCFIKKIAKKLVMVGFESLSDIDAELAGVISFEKNIGADFVVESIRELPKIIA